MLSSDHNGNIRISSSCDHVGQSLPELNTGEGISCGRSTHARCTFGIGYMIVSVPQLLTKWCQRHPPTFVSKCNCSPLFRAVLADTVYTVWEGSGILDSPGGGSTVCHRSRPVL